MIVPRDGSADGTRPFDVRTILRRAAEAVWLIVYFRPAVSIEAHRAVLVVGVIRALRFVHRQGVVVDAQAVAVRIGIRDQSPLQHFVRRKPHARHDVARLERRLLHFRKIIFRIAVQFQLADFDERIVLVRPHLRQIERVDVIGLRVLFRHDLHAHPPFGEVTLLDGVEKIALRVVWIRSFQRARLLAEEVLDPLLGFEVPFHVEEFVLRIDQAERVTAEAVHVPVAVRSPAVGEENRHLVQRFRRERPEIPHHRWRFQVRFRIALLCVDEIAELQRIANEENGRVISHHIPIAFFCVKLQGKPAWVACRIRRTFFAPHGRKPNESRRLLTDSTE